MLRKWLQKRRIKREQDECVHDYRVLYEYVDYDLHMHRTDMVALYCPKCNKERRITKNDWKIFLMKRHVHERYHSEVTDNEDKE